MITHFFQPVFYDPLYNGLIYLISILPSANVGLAVILFTSLIKLILFPLTRKSVITQAKMKRLEPELNAIKKKYEKDKPEQAKQTMEFYKKNDINPFSGFLLLLIQTPIIISLYYIFLRGGLPKIDINLLYGPLKYLASLTVNMHFLGIDIGKPSVIFGIIAGITQFIQVQFSVPPIEKPAADAPSSFKNDLARSMNMQFRYVLPIFIFIISLKVSGAVAVYWATSNLFIIGQELVVRKKFTRKAAI
jgi:YidC/Oxa1 family membrane protein insertase